MLVRGGSKIDKRVSQGGQWTLVLHEGRASEGGQMEKEYSEGLAVYDCVADFVAPHSCYSCHRQSNTRSRSFW